jgi:hypothetical protein
VQHLDMTISLETRRYLDEDGVSPLERSVHHPDMTISLEARRYLDALIYRKLVRLLQGDAH